VLDKTRFPAAAAAAGIRVADSVAAYDADDVARAFTGLGGPVFLKGRHGLAGTVVRRADDAAAAVEAADALGYPVLVERATGGLSCLMPCLYERGKLVGAIAAARLRTVHAFGPSTANAMRAVDSRLIRTARAAGVAFGLHGFVSIDYFDLGDGSDPVVLEINPRPVPQLHLGRRVGVDMAAALADVMAGGFDGTARLGTAGRDVVLFPQELQRLRAEHGARQGTLRWLRSAGALADVPWNDLPLAWRHLRRED
jgi:biotin carboxylase